jgi:hypothetical protein
MGRSERYWVHSAPEGTAAEEERRCSRGEWCSARVITWEGGERVALGAITPRAFCDTCELYLARLASQLPGFWLRLAHMIGDPLQAEVQVHIPFGPQVLLREDVDAHLRLMAVVLGGWAARVRAVPGLPVAPLRHAWDSAEGVRDNAKVLAKHPGPLFALPPGWMVRSFGFLPGRKGQPDVISEEIEAEHADTEIVRVGVGYVHLPVLASGEDAGREIQWLSYRARSILLETNPPPELLIVPCRECTWRALRRAWPAAGEERDLYSRCDHCSDEMTAAEYEANAKRWAAYYKAHANAGTPAQVAAGLVA